MEGISPLISRAIFALDFYSSQYRPDTGGCLGVRVAVEGEMSMVAGYAFREMLVGPWGKRMAHNVAAVCKISFLFAGSAWVTGVQRGLRGF